MQSGLVLVVDVEEHGGQQHQALDHLLVVDADAQDRHAVVHHAHDEGADHRAHDLADAARGRGAADEAGRDHVELEAEAGLRRRRVEARGEDQAGKRRQHAHVDEGAEGQALGLDARQLRRLLVAAQRIDAPADGRARGHEGVERDQQRHDDQHVRQALVGRQQIAEGKARCRQ